MKYKKSHATAWLFVNGLKSFDEYYEKGLIDKIFTTNFIYNTEELLKREWYCNVNMSKYIALLVDTINCDNSISRLLDPADKIHTVVKNHEEESK